MNSLVIGMGEVGKPLARMLDCEGIDRDGMHRGLVDVLNICFPYGDEFVEDVNGYIDHYTPYLCIIHSTVMPGTTKAIQEQWPQLTVAYSPVRGRHPLDEDLKRYDKFVAAEDYHHVHAAEIYLTCRDFRVSWMMPSATLELAKLFSTTYSGLLIAYAQEMDRYAKKLGVDYYSAARFFAEIDYLPPVVFQPGHIGGHCIMQNLTILDKVMPSPFIDAIRQSNAQAMPEKRRRFPKSFRELEDKK